MKMKGAAFSGTFAVGFTAEAWGVPYLSAARSTRCGGWASERLARLRHWRAQLVREAAAEHSAYPTTTSKAYSLSESEGYVGA